MRFKCKLSFSVLMISSCFVQIAGADERKESELKSISDGQMSVRKEVSKGSALSTALFSNQTRVLDGGVEIVENRGNAMEAIVEKGGMQIVTRRGTAINTKVISGQQFVFEEKSFFRLKNVDKYSSAYNTTVSGANGSIGQQNVYDSGIAWNTIVLREGEQNLYTGNGKSGGFALDTMVSDGGRQNVLKKGIAENTTLGTGAVQVVYPGGQVDGLTIGSGASSWIYTGAIISGKTIKVESGGNLHLYAGDNTNRVTKEKLFVVGRSSEDLFFVEAQNSGYKSNVYIEDLGGTGGTIDFVAVPYDQRYFSLHVDKLSGSLHFRFNISAKNNRGDYLVINKEGIGEHKVSVTDSGSELTNPLSQKNGVISTLYLITDRSSDEKANFTLVNHDGEEITAVDGGVFMYDLYKIEREGSSSGSSTMWYLGMKASKSNSSDVRSPRMKGRPKTPAFSSISAGKRFRSDFASRPPLWDVYMHGTDELKPKERPPRHLKENLPTLVHPASSLSEEQPFDFIVDADENKNGALKVIRYGQEVPKGSVLITTQMNNNVRVKDGGVEIVEHGKSSLKSTIDKGGMQMVTRGGTSLQAKVNGGKQLVFEEKSIVNIGDVNRRSSAYETTVSGEGGSIGQQNVYDGGKAWKTIILKGGEQNLYTGNSNIGGGASDTRVGEGGRQHILAQGIAENTLLENGAMQIVYPGGKIDGLTIGDGASSWLHVGAVVLGKEITVNEGGNLYLYAGDSTDNVTKSKFLVQERNPETIFYVGRRDDEKRSWFDIKTLSGTGGNVNFVSIPYDPRHLLLYVGDLSGNLHFNFNISTAGNKYSHYSHTNQYSNYLLIDKGKGNHTISIADSGDEITDFFSQNGTVPYLILVTDRSKDEGANFILVNHDGAKISAVDGGTFMYGLHKKKNKDDHFTTWYLGVENDKVNFPNPRFPGVSEQSKESIAVNMDEDHLSHQSPSRSRNRGSAVGSGRKRTSRPRPPRHLREKQPVSISSLEHQTARVSRSDNRSQPLSQKLQPVASPSLADEMIARSSVQNPLLSQVKQDEEIKVSDFLTTPSTDAVLSMAVAPALVFNNEVQTVRSGRGILDRNKKNASLWTYAIKSKEHVATGHIDFNLEQTGIVLGVNGLSELTNGEFYVGGFGGYDQARVAHARGGTSGINSYSIGAYATYFDHSGWYLDGVLKYNHYKNNLKAISTNGLSVQGDYTQWAVGTSFEAGYRFKTAQSSWMQPYAHLTWLQVEGKKIKLSHGMKGDIGRAVSLRSEVGLSLGYEFGSGTEMSSMAYITAAWLRENINNNHTTINKQHKFITDLSGNFGKLGIGLSGSVSDRLKLYAEGHYLKGRKIKQSLQGVLGIRYSF
ncbi:BafA family autotransporter [Bartonella sp. CB60]|uniref:BafA family autotransporter n=1 Tax=Bartonella sp. CB60 TaxID=3113619 RepID=UPI00300E4B45